MAILLALGAVSPAAAQQASMTYVPDSRLPDLLYLQQIAVAAADCHLLDIIVFNRIFDVGQEIERGQNLDGRVAIDIGNEATTRANAAYPRDQETGTIAPSACRRLAASDDLRQANTLYSAVMADKIP